MVAEMTIRPMTPDDVPACCDVFGLALNQMRRAIGLPPFHSDRLDGGVAHLLGTDPHGSLVAVGADDGPVGFAQAARRDELWVLAHLFVAPESQGLGLGRDLLGRAVAYGAGARSGIIVSTPEPRAIRSYARLPGFELHPMLQAGGRLDRRHLAAADGVREGGPADLDFAAHVDRLLRGGAHGPDLVYHLDAGAELLVLPDRGYAVASDAGPDIVAGLDTDAAAALLTASLHRCDDGAEVTIKRIGAAHQWAAAIAVAAGLELKPWGPLVTRDSPAATAPYIPDSAFC